MDLALPTSLQIRELIPRIRATLASGRDDDELIDESPDGDGLRPYSLAPLGGTPFSLDATLETLAIDDGEQLILCKLPPGPAAPPVVEDIADASAIHSANQFKPFEHTMLAGLVQAVVGVLDVLACGLGVFAWHRGYNLWAGAALAVPALVLLAATFLVAPPWSRPGCGPLGYRGEFPAGAGRSGCRCLVTLRRRGCFWPLPCLGVDPAVVGRDQQLGGALHRDGRDRRDRGGHRGRSHAGPLPLYDPGLRCSGGGVTAGQQCPHGVGDVGSFPLPNVPAPGEPTPPPSTLAEIEALPRKTATSNSYQNGLIAASVILSVVGSVLVLWLPGAPGWLAWWLVATVTTVTVLRMRIWDAALPALWFLATPFLAGATLSVTFAATNHFAAGLISAGALALLTALLLLAAIAKPRELTIPQRRWLDVFENLLLITIPSHAVAHWSGQPDP